MGLFFKKKVEIPVVSAVIVAAGSGSRMGRGDKLMLPLAERPVLAHTLLAFAKAAAVRDIVLVCKSETLPDYAALAKSFGIEKLRVLLCGGDTRTASVLAGLRACAPDTAFVAVHDGARPLVSPALIENALSVAFAHGAAAPVVPLKDSIKKVRGGMMIADVRRDTLRAVQTPQVFRYEWLLEALTEAERAGKSYTDDCAALEAQGRVIYTSAGSYRNIKITTPDDLAIAERLFYEEEVLCESDTATMSTGSSPTES